MFKTQCTTCHTVEAGKNRIEPNLFGVIGRHAGSAEGFKHSTVNKNSDVTWTSEVLDKYLVS